jgi:hypothetical protein
MLATRCIILLSSLSLSLDKDTVCIVTDGASGLTKTGKLPDELFMHVNDSDRNKTNHHVT